MNALIYLIVTPLIAAAGDYKIEVKEPEVIKARRPSLLAAKFQEAKGLNEWDVRSMHVQRIGCARRLFSPSGQSLEGDGDLKVTDMGSNMFEAELPSHFSFITFTDYNPYHNGVTDVDTVSSRQFLPIDKWKDGNSLTLRKYVSVKFADENVQPKVVLAQDEIKIMEGVFPRKYLVKETVHLDKPFVLYMICD